MLDTDTKRRIDTARDILVGKVPDPKSQVEQITIALIYKFMDDMDAESEELGGVRSFFAGEFERYGWAKLMAPGIGGHETLNLYAEAIARMPENPGIPALFRDIFKNAFLPYRDPETLKAFLKVIDDFSYDHSERLGDAFEYLLSVLGSQGDAGQFRTPRHIIDFMVALVDPRKDERILDPACGTAGFLISAFKHILAANERDGRPGAALSPDERTRLMGNIHGYDISPDMVRLSLVNLYLHGFNDPHVDEYDTLTSEDHWNEYYNVILANPPFMSPKGGIRPHKRFSVSSNRSEVLFVDYIAEHLLPGGRAAVIVPEGVIFQSGKAYKALRKLLVEEYLAGVISLPAGVFNPYSGVKTSILWLDKTLAKQTAGILFVKIEADGFDLGAQRKEIKRNDLPEALAGIQAFKQCASANQQFDSDLHAPLKLVTRQAVAENGDYNLSGERYSLTSHKETKYRSVTLGEITNGKPEYGSGAKKADWDGQVRYVRITDIDDDGRLKENGIVSPSTVEPQYFLKQGDVLFARSGSVGRCYLHKHINGRFQFAGYLIRFDIDRSQALPEYVFYITKTDQYQDWIATIKKSGTISNINAQEYSSLTFPLPPLAEQEAIVAEVESYQRIIDGARQVVENWRPRIEVDPAWEVVAIGELVSDKPYSIKAGPFGSSLKKDTYVSSGYKIYGQEQVIRGDVSFGDYYVSEDKYRELESCSVQAGDVLISLVGTYGRTLVIPHDFEPGIINPRLLKLTLDQEKMLPSYFVIAFAQDSIMSQVHSVSHGGTMNILSLRVLKDLRIPKPPLDMQFQIISQLEAEESLVCSSRDLITRFEQKIKDRIARVWG